jgi:hypothetical protein
MLVTWPAQPLSFWIEQAEQIRTHTCIAKSGGKIMEREIPDSFFTADSGLLDIKTLAALSLAWIDAHNSATRHAVSSITAF